MKRFKKIETLNKSPFVVRKDHRDLFKEAIDVMFFEKNRDVRTYVAGAIIPLWHRSFFYVSNRSLSGRYRLAYHLNTKDHGVLDFFGWVKAEEVAQWGVSHCGNELLRGDVRYRLHGEMEMFLPKGGISIK